MNNSQTLDWIVRRPPPQPRTTSMPRLRVSAMGLCCAIAGAISLVKLNIVGEIFAAELLLPFLGLAAAATPDGRRVFSEPVFRTLAAAALLTLCGYIVSDLVRGSSPEQYLRGWGRIVLMLTNFLSLAAILSKDRRNLWWLALGMGLGGIVYLRLGFGLPISRWKFGYAEPVTLTVACLMYFLPWRIGCLLLLLTGFISVHFDFRVQSAVCILIAAILWTRADERGRLGRSNAALFRLVAVGVVSGLLIIAGLFATRSDYAAQRRDASNVGREVGIVFGAKAVANSPIVGYGSWGLSAELESLHRQALDDVAGQNYDYATSGSTSGVHSQILQSWVEGGLLGATFFLVFGWQLLRNFKYAMLLRPIDALSPIILYFYLYSPWHLVMSAFSAPIRLFIALGASCVVIVASDQRAWRSRTA